MPALAERGAAVLPPPLCLTESVTTKQACDIAAVSYLENVKMEAAKQHWPILRKLETDLVYKVQSFMVIGEDGDGVLVATEDGLGFWLGKLQFELGQSKTANKPTPLDVPGLASMAHGQHHILLLNRRGEIYSMGKNNCGQLGLGRVDQETHFSPQLIPSPHKFTLVRCGESHSVALTEDGKVWAWGSNMWCQVGVGSSLGSTDYIRSIPSLRQIPDLEPHRVVAVECGCYHSLALTDQGEVYAWGDNACGQLGDGSETTKHTPTRIHTPSPVKSMAAGCLHTLLLTQTGEVYVCGENGWGQLGLPLDIEIKTRVSKVVGLPLISQIEAHFNTHLSIAMSFDKRCFVWGQQDNRKLKKKNILITTPRELPPVYSTVESPFFYSLYCSTPHSVQVSETLPNRLSSRMSRMFDNPETSDLQFVVEQRTIHAHQNILSNSSDYFARMFSERWLAPVDPEDPIVKVTIPDFSYEAFHAFLRFLYTDCLEVHFGLLPEIFAMASLYLVSDLRQLCLTRMRSSLIPATCCLYYQLVLRHPLPELDAFKQELIQFFSTRMSEVVDTAAYQSMESDHRDILANAARNFPGT